jgi:hypothetical protein
MPASIMFEVEIDRIRCVYEVHDLREIADGALQNEMIMVRHQTINMEVGREPFVGIMKNLHEIASIVIGKEDRLLLVPSNNDKSARILDPDMPARLSPPSLLLRRRRRVIFDDVEYEATYLLANHVG